MPLKFSDIRKQALISVLVLLSISFPSSVFASSQTLGNNITTVNSEVPQQVPPTNHISGPQSVLVILVRFKDVANAKTRDEVKDLVFVRLNNYFKEVSYGAAWLTGNVTSQWYQLSRSRSYYGAGSASSEKIVDLVVDAVRAADREVNYMNYEYVMVVYAGDDQNISGNANDISSGGNYGNGYPLTTSEGTLGFGVSWLSETDPIGPFAHFLGRNLRLPDLWNRAGNPLADNFVAEWDLMGHGFWADNGSTPAEPTSWCRMRLGWITELGIASVNATESKTLDIDQLETPTEGLKVIRLPMSKYTYYLIEVRRKIGYDSYLPDEGVLILYVDEMLEDGQGIVRVVDSTPLTQTLNDAPFKVGGIFENKTANIAVEVVSSSNSSYRVSIDRTGRPLSAYLTVDTSYSDIQVKVDGASLTSDDKNRVQKLVRIGSHVVEVPSLVYISETSRAIFNGWSDGDSTNPRTLAVNANSTLTADYKLQNLLQVSSIYGSPTGSGWYDANTVATFSVTNVIDQGNGTRQVFLSWTGDSDASSSTSQINMSKPRVVSAGWKTQYAIEFTSTGLKNGTTITLTVNGKDENHTVPFSHVEWFDKGSELTFEAYPESISSGITTFKLEGWTERDGSAASSPVAVTQPDKLTAAYSEKRLFDVPSSMTFSGTATMAWGIYLKAMSGTLSFLSRYPMLLSAFMLAAYPFFAVVAFAHKLYLTFSFASVFSAAASVIVASILLGLIYLLPISFVVLAVYRWRRKKVPGMRMILPFIGLWVLGLALVMACVVATTPAIEAIGVAGLGALAIGTAFLSALIPSIKIIGLTRLKRIEPSTKKTVTEQPAPKEQEEEKDEDSSWQI
jgi:M6 family metalloprotease-like protein